MDITISTKESIIIAKIVGPVTEPDGVLLKQSFNKLVESTYKKVAIDLSMVPIMTSTGIGKLIVLFHRLQEQERELMIDGIHDNLYTMFSSIKLDKLLTIKKH